jgi:hypothetical protein
MGNCRRLEDDAQDHFLVFQVRSIEQTYPHTLWLVGISRTAIGVGVGSCGQKYYNTITVLK